MPQHRASSSEPRTSRRRGAPKGNLNALKHGRRSRRVQAINAAARALAGTDSAVLAAIRTRRRNRELLALGLRAVADLLLAMPDTQTIRPGAPALIGKAARLAQNDAHTNEQTPDIRPAARSAPALPSVAASRHNQSAMPVRVLIAKPGLDGHDRGAKVVARALRDAGMEVIYTGIRQTPDMIAEAALQEDVDVIGLSILSGAHLELFPRVIQALRDRGIDPGETLLFAGGIIPDEDIPALKDLGFQEIFRPGTSTEDIIAYVRAWAERRTPSAAS